MNSMDFNGVLLRAKNGDSIAMEAVMEKYRLFIFKQCNKYRIPGYDFNDLVQHCYLSVIKAVKKYDISKGNFTGYVMMSISNNLVYLLRGEIKHFREVQDEFDFEFLKDEHEFTVEEQVIAYEKVEELYKGIEVLKLGERRVIEGYYLKGESLYDIAKELGITYAGVCKRKRVALEKLKDCLEK